MTASLPPLTNPLQVMEEVQQHMVVGEMNWAATVGPELPLVSSQSRGGRRSRCRREELIDARIDFIDGARDAIAS
ncbi:hypothetical protein ACFZAV_16370 [Streptomyces sp. NPDC008343]|uniref:hypothetical protein n=1 Tax=Streptomyces sp. NPDC008343 TaxID=3364828 RepID=UPI0036E94E0F